MRGYAAWAFSVDRVNSAGKLLTMTSDMDLPAICKTHPHSWAGADCGCEHGSCETCGGPKNESGTCAVCEERCIRCGAHAGRDAFCAACQKAERIKAGVDAALDEAWPDEDTVPNGKAVA